MKLPTLSRTRSSGVSATEYAIILVLCVVLSIGALIGLRNAILNMHGGVSKTVASSNTLSLITPKKAPHVTPSLETLKWDASIPSGGDSASYEGKSFKMDCSDPTSGCTMKLVPSSECTDATSVDGSTVSPCKMPIEYAYKDKECTTVADIFALAKTVDGLSKTYAGLGDSVTKLYAFATATCRLGGKGGCSSFFKGDAADRFEKSETITTTESGVKVKRTFVSYYGEYDAYKDILALKGDIYNLAMNPPAGMSDADKNLVRILASESFNMASTYVDQYKAAAATAGTTGPNNFTLESTDEGWLNTETSKSLRSELRDLYTYKDSTRRIADDIENDIKENKSLIKVSHTIVKKGKQEAFVYEKIQDSTGITLSDLVSKSPPAVSVDELRNVAENFLDIKTFPKNYTVKVAFKDALATEGVSRE